MRADVFGGKPIIRDMRIAVEHVLGMLAAGDSAETILHEYPVLEPEDIRRACSLPTAQSPVRMSTSACPSASLEVPPGRVRRVPEHARDTGRLGHDVLSASEAAPRATDDELLALALAEQRILITEDKDFGELVFVRRFLRPDQPHTF